jgi:hypothetical protein
MKFRPKISWPSSEREALYVMLVENTSNKYNNNSSRNNFLHYLAYNIPGDKLENADIAMDWITPFRYLLNMYLKIVRFCYTFILAKAPSSK